MGTSVLSVLLSHYSNRSDLEVDYEYFHDNPKLPIFERTPARYPAETIVRILLGTIDPLRVCSIQPLSVQANATFVVDTSKLASVKDLTADDNGAWQPTGKPCTWFRVLFDDSGNVSKVYKLSHKPAVLTKYTYALYRYYSRHQTCGDFKRTVATIVGK